MLVVIKILSVEGYRLVKNVIFDITYFTHPVGELYIHVNKCECGVNVLENAAQFGVILLKR